MSEVAFKDGDIVLIRGRIVNDGNTLMVAISLTNRLPPSWLDIVSVEAPNFKDGDRVVAKGLPGVILKTWPDGDLLWVKPDGADPWTVNVADCRREPLAPPSAEILTPLVAKWEAAE